MLVSFAVVLYYGWGWGKGMIDSIPVRGDPSAVTLTVALLLLGLGEAC